MLFFYESKDNTWKNLEEIILRRLNRPVYFKYFVVIKVNIVEERESHCRGSKGGPAHRAICRSTPAQSPELAEIMSRDARDELSNSN